jgi:SAM-dependent methyltransferase
MRSFAEAVDAGSYDAVVSLHTSFGLCTESEDQETVSQVAAVLRPSGRFLLDVTNRDWFLRYWGASVYARGPEFVARDYEQVGDTVYLHQEAFVPEHSRLRWTVTRVEGAERDTIEYEYRLYSLHEVAALFSGAGLVLDQTYGDYEGSRFGVHSPRIAALGCLQPTEGETP